MDPDRPKNNLPLEKPTFTLNDIRYLLNILSYL